MPNYVQIYFASTDSRQQVVTRIGSALGFEPSGRPHADHRGSTGHAGIPFGSMPYLLTVRDFQRGQLEERAARRMFDRLQGLNYRPMYLVRGPGQILESLD